MVDPVCVCVCVCARARACSYVGLGSPASQGLMNPSGYCCQSPNSLSQAPGVLPSARRGRQEPYSRVVPWDLPAFPEDLGLVMEGFLATPAAQETLGCGRPKSCHSHSERRSPRGREGEGDGTTAHRPHGRPGEPGRWLHCGSQVE